MTTILRPYQQTAVNEIRAHARASLGVEGAGCILQMPTGSGKTAVFCDVLKGAYAKGNSAIMIVRGKMLVANASDRLTREGVPHGVYQADNTRNTHERILICSVDTLFARRSVVPASLAVIDEVHQATSEGYRWVLDQYPDTFKLGVSATPHHKNGFRHVGDKLIRPISFTELVNQGYLVNARYFVPYIPNLKGVEKTGGDYNTKQLGKRAVEDDELTANAAAVWKNNLVGRSCLVFAVSVGHAEVLLAGLRGVGARGELITAATPDGTRRDYIGRLERGEIDALVSVGVLTTGVDIPSLRAILCCRPTESYNLWIQILGRGTRPYPGKNSFLCYDLSGNLQRHGPIEAEPIADLNGMPAVPKIPLKTCLSCFACFESAPICPSCGASCVEVRDRTTGERIHGLTENAEMVEKVVEAWEIALHDLAAVAKEKKYRKGWIYNQIKLQYGDAAGDKAWPRIRAMKRWETKNRKSA